MQSRSNEIELFKIGLGREVEDVALGNVPAVSRDGLNQLPDLFHL